MASESREEQELSIPLPAELDDWLDEQAAALEVDRERLLVQLLRFYQTAAELDGDLDADQFSIDHMEVAETVEDHLEAQMEERVQSILADTLESQVREETQTAVESILDEQLAEETNSIQNRLENRIDALEQSFSDKLDDVRSRVVQVKKETDTKAPQDHSHKEFKQIQRVAQQITKIEDDLETLEETIDETVSENEESLQNMDGRLEVMHKRLRTVAWVVSDLREAYDSGDERQTVEQIKRTAAKSDIERANCENCGEGVSIALLTDPTCPHCDMTVTNVEPASGWFGKPTLLSAIELESGDDS